MRDNCGCYSQKQLLTCSFMQNGQITLEGIINSEIPLKDKYWFVCKKVFTEDQNKEVAIAVAEIILPVFELKYTKDKRPRECIEAAKLFMSGHISFEQLREKENAAYAAAYAYANANAYAAAAVYAAAYAAASAAVSAAAYAAAAASAAASAAAYAAYREQLLNYLIDFVNKTS